MLPPSPQVACIQAASSVYAVPVSTIQRVISHAESGLPPMGIAAGWVPTLVKVGFKADQIASDRCVNIFAGTWIIAASNRRAIHRDMISKFKAREKSFYQDSCLASAAKMFKVPPQLLEAIIRTEGGRVGQIVVNKNGSFDMGPAQVNSIHLAELKKYGITKTDVVTNRCLNIRIGAWLLSRSLAGQNPNENPGEFWRRVGNYNSATPVHNIAYQRKVWRNLKAGASGRATFKNKVF